MYLDLRTLEMNTVSGNYYFYVLKILEKFGLNRNEVANIVPLEDEDNSEPSFRIPLELFYQLLTHAENRLNDPHIGLSVSKSFRISNYGYAGNIFSICNDLEQALSFTKQYGCLAHTLGLFRMETENDPNSDHIRLIWTPHYPKDQNEKYRQITECILSNYAITINWLCWSFEHKIENVSFKHSLMGSIERYSDNFEAPVKFDSHENSITFNKALLKEPLPTSNPVKLSILKQRLNQALAKYNSKSDLAGKVRYVLNDIIKHHRPNISLVAKELSLSERTLKRHLKEENTSFQDILKSVKIELFNGYSEEGLPYSEIAQLLWYHDQSALNRAYKKWHGATPSQHLNKANGRVLPP